MNLQELKSFLRNLVSNVARYLDQQVEAARVVIAVFKRN